MTTLLKYVKEDLGFGAYKESYLARRLHARMVRRGIESEEKYMEILKTDNQELLELKDALSINVTSFFRNPEVWGALKDILPRNKTIQAWSAACSEGKEPYSIAILCEEIGVDVKITATDVDDDALYKARQGIYRIEGKKEFTDIDLNFARYFDSNGNEIRVKPHLKRKINFINNNLVKDSPPAKNFDLVMCRNFLIYVEPEHKPIVAKNIADSLVAGGLLVLGKTETLPIQNLFEPIDRVNKIFRRI